MKLAAQVAQLKIPLAASMSFVPGAIKLTGPDVDPAKQMSYVTGLLGRLNKLGVKVVVFGSGGARRVPRRVLEGRGVHAVGGFLSPDCARRPRERHHNRRRAATQAGNEHHQHGPGGPGAREGRGSAGDQAPGRLLPSGGRGRERGHHLGRRAPARARPHRQPERPGVPAQPGRIRLRRLLLEPLQDWLPGPPQRRGVDDGLRGAGAAGDRPVAERPRVRERSRRLRARTTPDRVPRGRRPGACRPAGWRRGRAGRGERLRLHARAALGQLRGRVARAGPAHARSVPRQSEGTRLHERRGDGQAAAPVAARLRRGRPRETQGAAAGTGNQDRLPGRLPGLHGKRRQDGHSERRDGRDLCRRTGAPGEGPRHPLHPGVHRIRARRHALRRAVGDCRAGPEARREEGRRVRRDARRAEPPRHRHPSRRAAMAAAGGRRAQREGGIRRLVARAARHQRPRARGRREEDGAAHRATPRSQTTRSTRGRATTPS